MKLTKKILATVLGVSLPTLRKNTPSHLLSREKSFEAMKEKEILEHFGYTIEEFWQDFYEKIIEKKRKDLIQFDKKAQNS
jgi:hypothetical protein